MKYVEVRKRQIDTNEKLKKEKRMNDGFDLNEIWLWPVYDDTIY